MYCPLFGIAWLLLAPVSQMPDIWLFASYRGDLPGFMREVGPVRFWSTVDQLMTLKDAITTSS